MAITILDAMNDEKLFGKTFKKGFLGRDSWKRWRAFLGALFGLELDDEGLKIFRRHTNRVTAPAKQFSEAFCIVGRRGGKSRVAALIGIFLACFKNYDAFLA